VTWGRQSCRRARFRAGLSGQARHWSFYIFQSNLALVPVKFNSCRQTVGSALLGCRRPSGRRRARPRKLLRRSCQPRFDRIPFDVMSNPLERFAVATNVIIALVLPERAAATSNRSAAWSVKPFNDPDRCRAVTYGVTGAAKTEPPQKSAFVRDTVDPPFIVRKKFNPHEISIFQSESEPEIDVHRDEMGSAFACSPFPSYKGCASERPGAVKGAPLLRGEANP
jgi:hypothetical protein